MEKPVRSMHMDIVGSRAMGANLYRVTIAASEKVRQPPELDFDGLSTENYLRNPVVMWAHDAVGRSPSGGLPIGRTLNLAKTSAGQIVAEFEFLSDDPFVQRVQNAWDKGFLQAASISWVPLESAPVKGGGWRDARADLLEWSIVSVPADPDALRESQRLMMNTFLLEGVSPSAEGRGEGFREGEATEEVGNGEGLPLSPDEFDDLDMAQALIRDVVDRLKQSNGLRSSAGVASDRAEAVSEGDLSEIRAMVGALRSAVVSS